MPLDFTLLTAEQVGLDENGLVNQGLKALDVMKKYGRRTAPSDLAILLGACQDWPVDTRTSEGDKSCISWSLSPRRDDHEFILGATGGMQYVQGRTASVRPILPPSETARLAPSDRKTGVNGVDIVEYGEYPQTLTSKRTYQELEELYQTNSLKRTGKKYTFDSTDGGEYNVGFQPIDYPEYILNGQKFIRVEARFQSFPTPTNVLIDEGKPYWVQVEPIEWLVDPTGTWVSKKCLFGGIQFDTKETYDGDFKNTFMKHYLDTYFAKEMGHEELVATRRKEETLKGLQVKLSEISNLKKVKETVKPARTAERTDQLARIIRVRRAKEILSKAARKAQKEGDQEALREIMELAKPYAARDAVVREKVRLKRAERRSKRGRG